MYGDIATWRAYALARGNSDPIAASDEDATAALVRAGDYIKYRYVANLISTYDDTLDVVEFAAYEAANLELATVGFFSATYTEAQKKVLSEVKGIKWTVTGNSSIAYSSMPTLTVIDAMFKLYVVDLSAPQFMVRSVG